MRARAKDWCAIPARTFPPGLPQTLRANSNLLRCSMLHALLEFSNTSMYCGAHCFSSRFTTPLIQSVISVRITIKGYLRHALIGPHHIIAILGRCSRRWRSLPYSSLSLLRGLYKIALMVPCTINITELCSCNCVSHLLR